MTTEHEHGFDLFGTRVRLLIASPTDAPLAARIAALGVQARLTALHRRLTRFDPASELSLLNRHSGETVAVSPAMTAAIAAALRAADISEGLVDMTVLPALERAGYTTSRAGVRPADLAAAIAVAPPRRSAHAHPARGWRQIDLDPAAGTVRVPAGMRLDLGGSAKGMAVDLAARGLAAAPRFAVDAGGDIRLGGTEPAPRTVRIEHPLTGDVAVELTLAEGAIATSGLRTRIWRTADGYAHHLIDPATGEPAWSGVVQATALADSALEAETLAKTALLLGPDRGQRLLAHHGGALVLDGGETILAGELGPHRAGDPALTR
jgi:thiamine biosynthesis lipoprotein